ncbi:MAG TPA: AAA family ATPase [Verrucomicrobiota bacterium]|nr:AAA family ATPase [Verrucomicrobiota bacterium]
MKNIFRDEYLLLGRALLEQRDPTTALHCALMALRFDPECTEAREIARLAADAAVPAQRPGDQWTVLRERHRQLAVLIGRDPALAGLLGVLLDLPAAAPSAPTSADAEATEATVLLRRLEGCRQRVSAAGQRKTLEVADRLETLARQLRAAQTPADSPEAPDIESDDVYDGLDAEYQVHNLGNDFYKLNRFAEAAECYTLALALHPDLLESLFNRSLALLRSRHYDTSFADVMRVIEINPNLADAWFVRARIEESRGNLDAALAALEQTLAVDPDYGKAKDQIEAIRRRQRDADARDPARSNPAASATSQDKEGRILDFSGFRVESTRRFSDVCNVSARARLEMVAAFLKGHAAFEEWGCPYPHGVLLYGPPGTGKTLLAEALAGETGRPFYCTPATVFLNMWYGTTELNLRNFWQQASAHPEGAIVFFDEFDALGSRRSQPGVDDGMRCHDKAVACLLDLMDGFRRRPTRLVVLAATNNLPNVDPAFLRPGRFDFLIHVALPSEEEIAEIFRLHLQRAEGEARRVQFLDPELSRWVRMGGRRGGTGERLDPPSMARLAAVGRQHHLVGAEIAEIVRRVVSERAELAVREARDGGPVNADDLERHLGALIAERQQTALPEPASGHSFRHKLN